MSQLHKQRKRIKLKPELVPRTLWGRSVYGKLRAEGRRRDWEAIRIIIKRRCRGKCQICGHFQEKHMICHEKWKYDGDTLVATLVGFKLVCPPCNNTIHIGRTIAVMLDKYPNILIEVRQHMAKANERTLEETDRLIGKSVWKWIDIEDEDWTIEIDSKLIRRFPQLEGLEL